MSGPKEVTVRDAEILDDGTLLVTFTKEIVGQGRIRTLAITAEALYEIANECAEPAPGEPDLAGAVLADVDDIFPDDEDEEGDEGADAEPDADDLTAGEDLNSGARKIIDVDSEKED